MPAPSAHVPKLDSHADSRWPAHLPAGVFLLAMTSIVCPTLAAPKPNIIVIFTDDHGHADLSCQDVLPDIKTPNIDALAASGVRMTSGYVTAPQCVPSRAGILTGKYQNRFGVESNGMPLDGFNAERTIAERLKAAGYATGMIGKWHLGPIPAIPQHGFADVFAKNSGRPGWSNYGLDGGDAEPGPEATELYHLDACSLAARA
ncbi:MAG: sulfatase-like hydrolase/transferase, partial [Pirellulaceae bacterium]|nr:sulfatase-like hydrolase/transferase [Pirellulaceae bacterium]